MSINISKRVKILPCIKNTNIHIKLYLYIIKIRVENQNIIYIPTKMCFQSANTKKNIHCIGG